jgi:hypothetical protein
MNFPNSPSFILRMAIALAYIGLGTALLLNNISSGVLTPGLKYAFEALLIVYGSFRVYRAWTMYKNDEL